MTENFDGTEVSFIFASLDLPLKRRDCGRHTHSGCSRSSRCEASRSVERGVLCLYAAVTSAENNEADGLFQQPAIHPRAARPRWSRKSRPFIRRDSTTPSNITRHQAASSNAATGQLRGIYYRCQGSSQKSAGLAPRKVFIPCRNVEGACYVSHQEGMVDSTCPGGSVLPSI